MLNVLIGHIGLRGAQLETAPTSGLYIDDLPGLTSFSILNLSNEEKGPAIKTWEAIEKRAANLFLLDLKGGLHQLRYKVKCTEETFTTNYLTELTYPFLYRFGIEILKERKHSSRINAFTTIDLSRAEKLLEDFEGTLSRILNDSLKGIDIAADDDCFYRKPLIRDEYYLP